MNRWRGGLLRRFSSLYFLSVHLVWATYVIGITSIDLGYFQFYNLLFIRIIEAWRFAG